MNEILCYNKKEVLTREGRSALGEFTSKLKPSEPFYIHLLTEKQHKDKHRSTVQNNFYHKVIMSAMVYYVPYLENYELPLDKVIVHKLIKLYFCNLVRDDLITVIKYKHPITNGPITEAVVPSWSFHSMPQKIANEMMEFCKREIEKYSKVSFDKAVQAIV